MVDSSPGSVRFTDLLRGDAAGTAGWLRRTDAGTVLFLVLLVVAGAGSYGAAMGWWRDPRQSLFAAIKFPLVLLLTAMGNAALNAMLAPLLGVRLDGRQSFVAILISFSVGSAIMGACSPILWFLVWSASPGLATAGTGFAYHLIQTGHFGVIAVAGTLGNLRLFQLLATRGPRHRAGVLLIAWLLGNLLLGSQLCWILRPLIGSPDLPVEFMRQNAWEGSFYETLFRAALDVVKR